MTVRPVEVSLGPGEIALCELHARNAEIGGQSNVRSGQERQDALPIDQFVGQLATLAGCKWLYGKAQGHYAYRVGRWAADRAPEVGDGGSDVPGANIDFKGSLIRNETKELADYNLLVRPRERHPGWVYVLGIVSPDFGSVYLLGWEEDSNLPSEPESSGLFEGAYRVPARALQLCPPFGWSL